MSTERGDQPLDDRGDERTPSGSQVKLAKLNLSPYLKIGWHFLIKVIGPSLTVTALILAIIQLYQANKAERENKEAAQEVKQETKKLNDSFTIVASTQYIDVFPHNMPKIIELIHNTRNSLTVITDVAAYGHFSSPGNSGSYIRELSALSSRERMIDIRFLCYNSKETKHHLRDQFGDFDKLKETEQFGTYSFFHQTDVPKDKETLVTQIDRAGTTFLNSLKASKPTIRVTAQELPIFMWISDDKAAIFSLHNYGQNPREHSFITTDPKFIMRLKEIAEEAFGKSQEYQPEKH